ncbi:HAD family hydrolase [Candidatus Hodarchaeum mangrovi]
MSFEIISFDLWNTIAYIKKPFNLSFKQELNLAWELVKEVSNLFSFNEFMNLYHKFSVHNSILNNTKLKEITMDKVFLSIFSELNPQNIVANQKYTDLLIKSFFNNILEYTQIFSTIPSLLQDLKEHNFFLTLISDHDWPPNGYDLLNKFNLTAFFDTIVFSGEVGFHKPHYLMFETAINDLNLSNREQLLHIGDDYYRDVLGAINFGGKAIWLDFWSEEIYKEKRYRNPKNLPLHPGIVAKFAKIDEFGGSKFLKRLPQK